MKLFINTMSVLRGLNEVLWEIKLQQIARMSPPGTAATYVEAAKMRREAQERLDRFLSSLGVELAATWIGLDGLAAMGRDEAAIDLECARRDFTPDHSHATSSCTINREAIRRFGV